jgi:hypothetical protein
MAGSIERQALSTKELQSLGEAPAAEAREGNRNSRRPGMLERHWSFPAVSRVIEHAEVSSTLLKPEVPKTRIVVPGDVSSISRAPGLPQQTRAFLRFQIYSEARSW